jgi:epoxide hydrolase 4
VFNQRRIAASGVNLHAVECGHTQPTTDKPLMLFLHGFPECWRSWRPLMAAFSDEYRCVAIDNRGFGESDKPATLGAYAMSEIVADIAAVIANYGDAPAIVVGHDWGGIAAWHFAAAHPHAVARLVVLNGPHPNLFQHALATNAAQQHASQYIARLADANAEARIAALGLETFWMSLFGTHLARGTMTADDKAYYLKTWAKPGALTAMLNWYRAPNLALAPIAKISVPTLVLWGMDDPLLLPVLLDGLEDFADHITIARLPGVGHGVLHEAPDSVITHVRLWICA